ncbi:baseplate J/gp47 family protein [Anaerovorax sp. IOR16]|uniref:baseplate J/gp47 family protein n=1 Tax=Anaerovorax sp. IOR16 TaxID=2773458 RepID=UPI0019D1A4A4|nr:baseplate J/gp47 family protein [Anaerovorax sp. IOR16]
MMDEKILDEVIPVPDREELKNQIVNELEDEGFDITNFSSGGIFFTIIMIFIQIRIELVKLLRTVLSNMFVSSAKGIWLELKGADYSKKKKDPTKTRGNVTLKRTTAGTSIKIPQGYVFKTEQDINGEEFAFIVLEDVMMGKDDLTVKVLVEAEKEGSKYNLPSGQIKKSLIHIEGIDEITNEVGWITQEGSDLEDEESFRERTLNSWAELSAYPIRDKYKNVCEAVPGVLFATVDDMHPRGQGTVDIIITSTAGEATQSLLDEVKEAADKIKAPYDNLLVKSAQVVTQDLNVTLYISSLSDDTGLEEKAMSTIIEAFKRTKNRNLNEFYKSDLIFALKKDIDILKNIKINTPADDVILENDKVIVLGNVDLTIEKV